MDFSELAKERYSFRSFSTKEVEKVEKILETAKIQQCIMQW